MAVALKIKNKSTGPFKVKFNRGTPPEIMRLVSNTIILPGEVSRVPAKAVPYVDKANLKQSCLSGLVRYREIKIVSHKPKKDTSKSSTRRKQRKSPKPKSKIAKKSGGEVLSPKKVEADLENMSSKSEKTSTDKE